MKRITLISTAFLLAVSMLASGCLMARHRDRKAQALTAKYSDYRIEMERINLERQKSGLTPSPIQSYDEWNKSRPLR